MGRKVKLIVSLAFIVVISLVAGSAYKSYCHDISVYNKQIDDLDKQLDAQRKYSKELDATGSEYMSQENVIRIARETLGLVKSGEKFFKNYNDNQ